MEFDTASVAAQRLLLPGALGIAGGVFLTWLSRRAPRAARAVAMGAAAAGLMALLFLGAFALGITPASTVERELVAFVRATHADRPAVRAALRVADQGLYLSKGDAERIATAALTEVSK